jgi:hypothetical protein
LRALLATQIEIQPKVSLEKEWHVYVAGDGVHASRAGAFAKFIPWSEVESVRAAIIKGRHGQPVDLPASNRHAVLRQVRDEWHKHYPEACEADRRRARRQYLLAVFVGLPVSLILLMMLELYAAEVKRDRSLGEAVRVVLTTKLHWAILLGMGLSALILWLLWFGRSLCLHESSPHETGTPDCES